MKRLFPILLIVFPILIILLLELGLRVFGFGYDDDLFADYKELDGYLIPNPQVALRYFPPLSPTGFPSDDIFSIQKDENTIRIFTLGGSTTAGFPYFFNGSFVKHFEDRLTQTYPGSKFEVINLGMTAVNSYTVRDFAKECLLYDPDLIIVYAGHNEFYGVLGSASAQASVFGTNRLLTLAYLRLKRLKIYQAIQSLTRWVKSNQETDTHAGQGTLMARMAEEKSIALDSPLYHATKTIFEANLRDIARWADDRNVSVLFSTLVSNLRDQKPFVSIHSSAADTSGFALRWQRVKQLMLTSSYSSALDTLKKMITIDPGYALLHFYAGRCAELQEQYRIAARYYRRARDLDGLRFRATDEFNDVIRSVANRPGAFLCEMEVALEQHAVNGLIGKDLMLEHLHPNLEGYFRLGQILAESVIDQNILHQVIPQLPEAVALPDDDYFRDRIAVTALDKKIAELQTRILMSGWPFATDRRHLSLSDINPRNKLEEIARATLKKELNYWEAHQQMADYYIGKNQTSEAVAECRALIRAFPYHWKSHLLLGKFLVKSGQFDKALPVLKTVADKTSEPFSQKWIGSILLNNGRVREAIPHLELALKLEPADHQCRYNLAGAYLLDQQIDKALTLLDYLLEQAPDYPGAQTLFEQIKKSHR